MACLCTFCYSGKITINVNKPPEHSISLDLLYVNICSEYCCCCCCSGGGDGDGDGVDVDNNYNYNFPICYQACLSRRRCHLQIGKEFLPAQHLQSIFVRI